MFYFSGLVTSLFSSPPSDFIWLLKALSSLSCSSQAKDVGNRSYGVLHNKNTKPKSWLEMQFQKLD